MDSKPPAYDGGGGGEKRPDNFSQPDSSQTPAQPPATATSFRTNFASVSLHMSDRIRFLGFSSEDVTHIRRVIRECWPKGIQVRMFSRTDEVVIVFLVGLNIF